MVHSAIMLSGTMWHAFRDRTHQKHSKPQCVHSMQSPVDRCGWWSWPWIPAVGFQLPREIAQWGSVFIAHGNSTKIYVYIILDIALYYLRVCTNHAFSVMSHYQIILQTPHTSASRANKTHWCWLKSWLNSSTIFPMCPPSSFQGLWCHGLPWPESHTPDGCTNQCMIATCNALLSDITNIIWGLLFWTKWISFESYEKLS